MRGGLLRNTAEPTELKLGNINEPTAMKTTIPFLNNTHEYNSSFVSDVISSLDRLCLKHLPALEQFLESINYEASVTYLGIHGVMIPRYDLKGSKYFCFGDYAKRLEVAQKHLVKVISEHGLTCESDEYLGQTMDTFSIAFEDLLEHSTKTDAGSLIISSRPYFYRLKSADETNLLSTHVACALVQIKGRNIRRPFHASVRAWQETRLNPPSESSHLERLPRGFLDLLVIEFLSVIIKTVVSGGNEMFASRAISAAHAAKLMNVWIESALGWGMEGIGDVHRFKTDFTSLFEWCCKISHQIHEGQPLCGYLAFLTGKNEIEYDCKLTAPVPCKNMRAAGKLISCSHRQSPALVIGNNIVGFGRPKPKKACSGPNRGVVSVQRVLISEQTSGRDFNAPHMIEFRGSANWKWTFLGAHVLEVRNDEPSGSRVDCSARTFRELYHSVFDSKDWLPAWQLVHHAVKAKHGALLIFSEKAETESARLQVGFKVEANQLGSHLYQRLCSIDGATLASPDGAVHAFGLILDSGARQDVGDLSRGSRFNAAARYFEAQKEQGIKVLVICISEDGFIDLFPKPPRFLQQETAKAFARLSKRTTVSSSKK